MATCWLLFAPVSFFFFKAIHTEHLVTLTGYLVGIPLGIILNVVGIVKLIDWMKDKDSPYIFPQRSLPGFKSGA